MNCFNCHSKKIYYIFSTIDYVTKQKFEVLRCNKCFLDFPKPRPKNIDKYYPKFYREYNFFVKKIFEVFYKKKAESIDLLFNNKKNKKILEIGCGNGFLLSIFKSYGWKVFGTERKSSINKRNNKELNISDKKISNFKNNFFDLILLNNSFEHLLDLENVKKSFKKKLKRKGLLIINIPSRNSFQYIIGKGDWFHLDVPRHLQIFDDKYFFHYAKKNNLQILKKKSIGFMWEFYGWFQTFNNKFFLNRNLFFKSLSNFKNNKISFFIGFFQFIILGPLSLILTLISFIFNRGSIIQFVIRKN